MRSRLSAGEGREGRGGEAEGEARRQGGRTRVMAVAGWRPLGVGGRARAWVPSVVEEGAYTRESVVGFEGRVGRRRRRWWW